ncbi:hypothetical protein R078138_01458 [Convivina praedatoris]|uniref:NADH dehydrogenase subunit 4 n=1 Tax=Convivina praedatoris TaxID=2880963 RepID=A0ABM9D542_9LACO|nr:hypothetical protein R077815_01305 [Convivina sp. LMG 32447]CAH1856602.1 hypothetical protein LMG032447_01325 [Convivina sp. LMG 32447]CAH1856871.1 hypothetical protein R078138_01458 [Convivina sp. LMG 32447]
MTLGMFIALIVLLSYFVLMFLYTRSTYYHDNIRTHNGKPMSFSKAYILNLLLVLWFLP